MNRAQCRSLALTALLCGAGSVVAGESDGLSRSLLPSPETPARPGFQPDSRVELDLARFFGGGVLEWGNNRFAVPLKQEAWHLDSRRSLLVNALAIEWQHSMNAANSLTLSARRDSLYIDSTAMDGGSTGNAGAVFRPELPVTSGTTATLSWNSLFGNESRVSGRLYAGDEEAKASSNGERRYFGMHLEGRYGLWRDHAPFASLLWQRSNTEIPDNTGSVGSLYRRENFSRFAAGWNWQVSPSWDVRAEANYRLVDDSAEVGEFDRTQLYFSTRYGFR
jgi:hypothetical protein